MREVLREREGKREIKEEERKLGGLKLVSSRVPPREKVVHI